MPELLAAIDALAVIEKGHNDYEKAVANFRRALRAWRSTQACLSRDRLAALLDVTSQTVYRWEMSTTIPPSKSNLTRLRSVVMNNQRNQGAMGNSYTDLTDALRQANWEVVPLESLARIVPLLEEAHLKAKEAWSLRSKLRQLQDPTFDPDTFLIEQMLKE